MKYSDKVLEFATAAHKGQSRKYSGIPYITHPIAVAKIALEKKKKSLGSLWGTKGFEYVEDFILSVGYLHDVLEDTHVTEDELRQFLMPLAGDMADYLVYVVSLLTKKKDFDLIKYLDGIKSDSFAVVVKIADNEHNISDLKDQKKLDYYKLIKYYLEH
jgi:GTP pyrophosphokinase